MSWGADSLSAGIFVDSEVVVDAGVAMSISHRSFPLLLGRVTLLYSRGIEFLSLERDSNFGRAMTMTSRRKLDTCNYNDSHSST
jgi:hypothetical protein